MDSDENKLSIPGFVRSMDRRDVGEVFCIEEICFDFPWSKKEFHRYLEDEGGGGNCRSLVFESNRCAMGYLIYEEMTDYLRIVNIAVEPAYQRCGIGSKLLKELIDQLPDHGRRLILLTVREWNLDAQLFFRDHGFRFFHPILHRFYQDTDEDAYQMRFRCRCKNATPANRISSFLP